MILFDFPTSMEELRRREVINKITQKHYFSNDIILKERIDKLLMKSDYRNKMLSLRDISLNIPIANINNRTIKNFITSKVGSIIKKQYKLSSCLKIN